MGERPELDEAVPDCATTAGAAGVLDDEVVALELDVLDDEVDGDLLDDEVDGDLLDGALVVLVDDVLDGDVVLVDDLLGDEVVLLADELLDDELVVLDVDEELAGT